VVPENRFLMEQPLVTIIGLCYNHAPYLSAALESVAAQTYPNLQVILVDDASTDNSPGLLKEWAEKFNWELILLPENLGNCAAFNRGFALTRGKYLVDFALDDVMLPQRIAGQVKCLQEAAADVGVVYTDAELIDEKGAHIRYHFEKRRAQPGKWPPPSGDVFQAVLREYFISTPTMLIRTRVLEEMGGYDETLAYEDFDFWVRSSRTWHYAYLDQVLTQKRILPDSLSRVFTKANQHRFFETTYLVCRKAWHRHRGKADRIALATRCRYEMRQALLTGHRDLVPRYFELLQELEQVNRQDKFINRLVTFPLNWLPLYNLYRKFSSP
jgi:glycosyltransferase involved in cell wall biosynthesis